MEFESVIKRGFLSTNFEAMGELLASSAVSESGASGSANPGSVPQLPWIPQTTAAVALRLLELDGCISYNLDQKVEILENKEGEGFTVESCFFIALLPLLGIFGLLISLVQLSGKEI